MNPGYRQDIEDDRESAFHVMTWTALRYISHDHMEAKDLQTCLEPHDQTTVLRGGVIGGGTLKRDMLEHRFKFTFKDRPQFNALLEELRVAFAQRYKELPPDSEIKELAQERGETPEDYLKPLLKVRARHIQQIKESKWFVDILRKHLQSGNWPENDGAEANPLGVGTSKKRKMQDNDLQFRVAPKSPKVSRRSYRGSTKDGGKVNKST